jgi:hypothetical protein
VPRERIVGEVLARFLQQPVPELGEAGMLARPLGIHEVVREFCFEAFVEQWHQAPGFDRRPRQGEPAERDAEALGRSAMEGVGIVEVGDEALGWRAAELREPVAPLSAGCTEQRVFAERLQCRPAQALEQRGTRGRRHPVVEQRHRLQSRPRAGAIAHAGI